MSDAGDEKTLIYKRQCRCKGISSLVVPTSSVQHEAYRLTSAQKVSLRTASLVYIQRAGGQRRLRYYIYWVTLCLYTFSSMRRGLPGNQSQYPAEMILFEALAN